MDQSQFCRTISQSYLTQIMSRDRYYQNNNKILQNQVVESREINQNKV